MCVRLEDGRLLDYLVAHDELMEEKVAFFIRETLEALQHLHTCRVAHLDLKVGTTQISADFCFYSKNDCMIVHFCCSLRTSWSTFTLQLRASNSSTWGMPSSCLPTAVTSTSCSVTQSLRHRSSSAGHRSPSRQTCGVSACWLTSCSAAFPRFWMNPQRKPASTSAAWTSASRMNTSVM